MPRFFVYNTTMVLMNLSDLINDPLGFLKQLACVLPVMLFSLTLHEWGHAYAAHKCGDDTAKNLGRMTLNPLAHIDPMGFLMLLLVGFGWAKPVPVNSRNFRNYKKDEAIVSLAGVFMNLLLVIAFSFLYVLFLYLEYTKGYRWISSDVLWTVITYGIALNLMLMLFNLLPVYPLDGYHIFELLFAKRLPMRVFLFLRKYGTFILIGVLLLMRYFNPAAKLMTLLFALLNRIVIHLLGI